MKYSPDAMQDLGSAGDPLPFHSVSIHCDRSPTDFYRDLIVHEIPINEMMSRVPVMLSIGAHSLEGDPFSPEQKRALRRAQKSWSSVTDFYETREPALLRKVNNEMVGKKDTPLNYRLALQSSTAAYQSDIYQAHERLLRTMDNLSHAGFGYENYRPINIRHYLKKSA